MAIKSVGLWGDAEKTFLLSKPYLDNLWKTIDDVEAQEQKAQELINKMNTDGTQDKTNKDKTVTE